MERRRRAMGLKKPGFSPEKKYPRSSRRTSTSVENSNHHCEDRTNSKGKVSQKIQPTGCVTPKQKISVPQRSATPLKPESPCSPLQSPSSQILFPGTLASPEIEVSWDWSCSQVPSDMLPPKKIKRVLDTKPQRPVLPTINIQSRSRPPLQRQITEEENQQRLEYYKNILSLQPPENSSNDIYGSTNNNVDPSKMFTTPKRRSTRLSSASKKRDEEHSLFDDSANEFMLECSQAIEEKLKSGEIDMGSIVDLEISKGKRLHSPGLDNDNSPIKKNCHGRVNLFPVTLSSNHNRESRYNENNQKDSNPHQKHSVSKFNTHNFEKVPPKCDINGVSEDKVYCNENSLINNKTKVNNFKSSLNCNNLLHKPLNSNSNNLEQRPLLANSDKSSNYQLISNQTSSSQTRCTERIHTRANATNHDFIGSLNKLDNGNKTCKDNHNFPKHQNQSVSNVRKLNVKSQETSNTGLDKELQTSKLCFTIQDKSNNSDITSLLDDDFNLELSCLDVDSLCQSSDNRPEGKSASSSASQLCTQKEIEARRQAAIQKLRMKNKR